MGNAEFFYLIMKRHYYKPLTPAEDEILDTWIAESPHHKRLFDQFGDLGWIAKNLKKMEELTEKKELIRERILTSITKLKKKPGKM